jgi:hypothetical protein
LIGSPTNCPENTACQDGACVELPAPIPSVECRDDDSGKDYYVKGSLTLSPGIKEELDERGLESSDGLVVHSPTTATLKLNNETKEVILGNNYEFTFGALLIDEINYFGDGNISNNIVVMITSIKDTCYDNLVMEWYCDETNPKGFDDEGYLCPNGCLDGACVIGPTQFSIKLNPGWNLISIPLVLENNSIEDVLADIRSDVSVVYAYDPEDEWSVWHPEPAIPSNLDTIELGRGYWIEMKNPATLTVEGVLFETTELSPPPSFSLKAGWNLVGIYSLDNRFMYTAFASIENKYSTLWAYDTGTGELVKLFSKADPELALADPRLEAGKGYWVYMIQEGDIVP